MGTPAAWQGRACDASRVPTASGPRPGRRRRRRPRTAAAAARHVIRSASWSYDPWIPLHLFLNLAFGTASTRPHFLTTSHLKPSNISSFGEYLIAVRHCTPSRADCRDPLRPRREAPSNARPYKDVQALETDRRVGRGVGWEASWQFNWDARSSKRRGPWTCGLVTSAVGLAYSLGVAGRCSEPCNVGPGIT